MALDEVHARRLETLVTLVEDALDRMELVLRGLANDPKAGPTSSQVTPEEINRIGEKMETMRQRLSYVIKRFSVDPYRPEPRRRLLAELSILWVILENANPERMRGYSKEFAAADKADWEKWIQELLGDVEQMRRIALAKPTAVKENPSVQSE